MWTNTPHRYVIGLRGTADYPPEIVGTISTVSPSAN